MAVLSGVLWGSAGIFVRILGDWGMDGATIVFSRVLIAVFIMGALILVTDRRMFRIKMSDLWIFIVCALSMVLLNLFYTISVGGASLSLAAVLLSMSPAFMLLMARALFGERITRRKTGCMLLAIIGCILVSGLLENPGSVSAEGIGAGIAAAFFYAFYGIMSKRAASGGYSTYTILFFCILFSAIVLLPFSDLNAVVEYGSEGLGSIALLVIQALFSSVLPYIFYTVAVTKGGGRYGFAARGMRGADGSSCVRIGVLHGDTFAVDDPRYAAGGRFHRRDVLAGWEERAPVQMKSDSCRV